MRTLTEEMGAPLTQKKIKKLVLKKYCFVVFIYKNIGNKIELERHGCNG